MPSHGPHWWLPAVAEVSLKPPGVSGSCQTLSGRSRQQHPGFPHRSTTRPASTRHPHSAQRISMPSIVPSDRPDHRSHSAEVVRPCARLTCTVSTGEGDPGHPDLTRYALTLAPPAVSPGRPRPRTQFSHWA
jgi:hypothetical protein